MPELPEVEVVRLFLSQHLINKTISRLEIFNPKSFIGDPKLILCQKIKKFTRIGKQLSIHLENNLIILIHLKMTGQLIYIPNKNQVTTILGHPTPHEDKKWPNKSTRLQFNFSDKPENDIGVCHKSRPGECIYYL